MSRKVQIDLDANDASMVQAWMRGRRDIRAFEADLKKMSDTADKAHRKTGRSARASSQHWKAASNEIASFAKQMVGFTAVTQGIREVVRVFSEERAAFNASQETRRIATLEPAAAIRESKKAFVPDETLGRDQLENTIITLAKETRTTVSKSAAVLTDALSAKGDLSNQIAVDAAREALRFAKDPAEARLLAGAALDIEKETRTGDVRSSLGFLQNVQSAARLTSVQAVADSLPSAISASMARGDTAEQGAEMFATLSQIAADRIGKSTSTAQIALVNQLAAFSPKRINKDEDGRKFTIPKEDIEAYKAATNTEERIAILRENEQLRNAFLDEASFEKRFQSPVERIVSGEDKAVGVQEQAQDVIQPVDAKQIPLFESAIQFAESGRTAPELIAEEQRATSKEQIALDATESTRTASARKFLQDAIESTDFTGYDQPTDQALMHAFEKAVEHGQMPERAAMRILESTLRQRGGALSMSDGPLVSDEFRPEFESAIVALRELTERQIAAGNVQTDQLQFVANAIQESLDDNRSFDPDADRRLLQLIRDAIASQRQQPQPVELPSTPVPLQIPEPVTVEPAAIPPRIPDVEPKSKQVVSPPPVVEIKPASPDAVPNPPPPTVERTEKETHTDQDRHVTERHHETDREVERTHDRERTEHTERVETSAIESGEINELVAATKETNRLLGQLVLRRPKPPEIKTPPAQVSVSISEKSSRRVRVDATSPPSPPQSAAFDSRIS